VQGRCVWLHSLALLGIAFKHLRQAREDKFDAVQLVGRQSSTCLSVQACHSLYNAGTRSTPCCTHSLWEVHIAPKGRWLPWHCLMCVCVVCMRPKQEWGE
jgi:hypothetical protein